MTHLALGMIILMAKATQAVMDKTSSGTRNISENIFAYSTGQPKDRFGNKIVVDGSHLFTSSVGEGGLYNAIHVNEIEATSLKVKVKREGENRLAPGRLFCVTSFASALASFDGILFVAARDNDLPNQSLLESPFREGKEEKIAEAGTVFVFNEPSNEELSLRTPQLIASDASPKSHFGSALSAHRFGLVVGASGEDSFFDNTNTGDASAATRRGGPGAAYVFRRSPTG